MAPHTHWTRTCWSWLPYWIVQCLIVWNCIPASLLVWHAVCLNEGAWRQFAWLHSCSLTWSHSHSLTWSLILSPDPTLILLPDPTLILSPDPTLILSPDPTLILSPDLTLILLPDPTLILLPDLTLILSPDPTLMQSTETGKSGMVTMDARCTHWWALFSPCTPDPLHHNEIRVQNSTSKCGKQVEERWKWRWTSSHTAVTSTWSLSGCHTLAIPAGEREGGQWVSVAAPSITT